MNKFYLLARNTHRLLALIISVVALIMIITGGAMKFPFFAEGRSLNLALLRYLHGNMSALFSLLLVLMIFSGLFMYFFPLLRKK